MAAAEHERSLCPRCGQPLQRERRRTFHRLLSLVYPVRYYVCSRECGWTGLRFAASQFAVRKRRAIRVLIVILLAMCGIMAARHVISTSGSASEESGEE
jgi:hypothetical protein